MSPGPAHIALAWKIALTVFLAILIPFYLRAYGPTNFLWFSDIALFGLTLGLWLESPLLVGMMAVGTLLPEIAWNVDYFGRLITGHHLTGQTAYMFESHRSLFIRGLSLFHVAMPPLLLYFTIRLGYPAAALPWQTALGVAVLIATFFLTRPQENINYVFGPGFVQTWMPGWAWLLIMLVAWPTLVYVPTHFVLKWLAAPPPPLPA